MTGRSDEPSNTEQVRDVWSTGSYAVVAKNFLPMAAHLVEATGVSPGARVLDVACGTGNVAVTAARRGATVTGLDITPSLLAQARENAATGGLDDVVWREGDATDLPFEDDAFDVTLSCVGHMFAEPPEAAGRELCRVTRPGGRIGFTCWTPESVVPAMGKTLQAYVPPDPDPSPPPFAWGDADAVADRLGDRVTDLAFETGSVSHPVLSPVHYWEEVTAISGLIIVALDAVDETDREALREEMLDAIRPYFQDEENCVRMDYRATTATVEGPP